jgi:hypothetical protein
MERTRYRIEVGRQGLEAIEDANGSWEYHADAQRTIDAEREKVKRLKKRLAEEHPGLDEVCDERDALRAQLRQVEGERDGLEQNCLDNHAATEQAE